MKKYYILLGMLFCLILIPGHADAKSWPKGPSNISAQGAIVIDAKSGMVLYGKNINQKRYPASITKVMTALLALENSTMSEVVTYRGEAVLNLESGASNIETKVGEKLTMEQSLYAMLIHSANEICNGVAIHLNGSVSAFAGQMNKRAKELGCKNTHFTNPNGLWSEKHYTTPYDMALIMREAMKNADFRTIAGTRHYEIPKTNKTKKKRSLVSHHHMIFSISYPEYGYDYAIAGKTGYTSLSEATVVTAAKKGDMELICVVMKTKSAMQGEPNIFTDSIKLFNYCFEKFSQHTLGESVAGDVVDEYMFTKFSPFYSSEQPTLSLDGDGSVILPKNVSLNKAEKKVEYFTELRKQNGKEMIGRLTYVYNGKEAGGANIIYNETNKTTMLTDSINMKEWVDEAVVQASKPPFPWKNIFLIVGISAVAAAIAAVIILRVRFIINAKKRREGYKKAKSTEETGGIIRKQ